MTNLLVLITATSLPSLSKNSPDTLAPFGVMESSRRFLPRDLTRGTRFVPCVITIQPPMKKYVSSGFKPKAYASNGVWPKNDGIGSFAGCKRPENSSTCPCGPYSKYNPNTASTTFRLITIPQQVLADDLDTLSREFSKLMTVWRKANATETPPETNNEAAIHGGA